QFRDERKESRQIFRASREAREHVFTALTADPYSPTDLEAALQAAQDADVKAVMRMHEITSRVIGALTPEEHAALARELKRCFSGDEHKAPPREGCGPMMGAGFGFQKRIGGDGPRPGPDNDETPPPPPPGPPGSSEPPPPAP